MNLNPSAKDLQLWEATDRASDQLAVALANGHKIDVIGRNLTRVLAADVDATTLTTNLPYIIQDAANPTGRRDSLGTTQHEAGTLRMGMIRVHP